jgi:hypothetical protein
MKISSSNLEIEAIELGAEKKATTQDEKAALALLGLTDSTTHPVSVTFKVKSRCVAVADAIQSSIFSEKKISCRNIEPGQQPNLRYVKSWRRSGFQQFADYADGKILEPGQTFKASGELVFLTASNGKSDSSTYFQTID